MRDGWVYWPFCQIPGEIEKRVKQRLQCKSEETDVAVVVESSCHQVTQQRYLDQMKEASQQAITQLLDKIVEDQRMSLKDKKQKLKEVIDPTILQILISCWV